MKVSIIGAGVAGMTCAVELAERGAAVEVFEQASGFGARSCSWYAGAMLAPWCECEHSADAVAELGEQSISWWRDRVPDVVQRGTLVVAQGRDVSELVRLSRLTTRYEWLDEAGIAELEPALAARFHQALYFKDEAHVDPRRALPSLAQRFKSLGGRIHFGARQPTAAATAERVIDCTGLAAGHALSDLRGVKGEMLLIRSSEVRLNRPVRLLHPRLPVYVVPREDGVFMVGATSIENDDASSVTARSVVELLSAAYALHPAFAEAAVIELGAHVRPAFPDNMPRIENKQGRLYVNGFYRHGFLLAPAFARMAADAVMNGVATVEVNA